MIILNLNRDKIKWHPLSCASDNLENKSKLHIRARELLHDIFPTETILEEVYVHCIKLYLDFFLPIQKTVIEVNGKQHYEFVYHFHQTKLGFYRYQANDQTKRYWCKLNDFLLVELPYSEDKHEWKTRF